MAVHDVEVVQRIEPFIAFYRRQFKCPEHSFHHVSSKVRFHCNFLGSKGEKWEHGPLVWALLSHTLTKCVEAVDVDILDYFGDTRSMVDGKASVCL